MMHREVNVYTSHKINQHISRIQEELEKHGEKRPGRLDWFELRHHISLDEEEKKRLQWRVSLARKYIQLRRDEFEERPEDRRVRLRGLFDQRQLHRVKQRCLGRRARMHLLYHPKRLKAQRRYRLKQRAMLHELYRHAASHTESILCRMATLPQEIIELIFDKYFHLHCPRAVWTSMNRNPLLVLVVHLLGVDDMRSLLGQANEEYSHTGSEDTVQAKRAHDMIRQDDTPLVVGLRKSFWRNCRVCVSDESFLGICFQDVQHVQLSLDEFLDGLPELTNEMLPRLRTLWLLAVIEDSTLNSRPSAEAVASWEWRMSYIQDRVGCLKDVTVRIGLVYSNHEKIGTFNLTGRFAQSSAGIAESIARIVDGCIDD